MLPAFRMRLRSRVSGTSGELQKAVRSGLDATLFFVVQMKDVRSVAPMTTPILPSVRLCGRQRLQECTCAWDCDVTPESLAIRREVPVIL